MAFQTITTQRGIVRYAILPASNSSYISLWNVRPDVDPPQRIGYAYLFNAQDSGGGTTLLIDRFAVYMPGTRRFTPAGALVPQTLYRLVVDWDVAGISVTFFY